MTDQPRVQLKQREMTTYRREDGEPIGGEYAFVIGDEWLDGEADDADEPITFVEERWVLVAERVFQLPLCRVCGEEPATYWGLCEKHAREDDPEAFDD